MCFMLTNVLAEFHITSSRGCRDLTNVRHNLQMVIPFMVKMLSLHVFCLPILDIKFWNCSGAGDQTSTLPDTIFLLKVRDNNSKQRGGIYTHTFKSIASVQLRSKQQEKVLIFKRRQKRHDVPLAGIHVKRVVYHLLRSTIITNASWSVRMKLTSSRQLSERSII